MSIAIARQQQPGDPLHAVQVEREQLTHVLRGLATRLDELDRELADLAWRRQPHRVMDEMLCRRTALESERRQLTDRLRGLAGQLSAIDCRLSGELPPAPGLGTCPYCGYPTLGSGTCAFCRPHLAR